MKKIIIFTLMVILFTANNANADDNANFVQASIVKNENNIIQIKLNDKNKKSINLSDLKEVHTEKIHLLIIDEALEDYSHVHPKAVDGQEGVYEFKWEAKNTNNYRLWLDIVPVATGKQEYVMVDLISDKPHADAQKQESLEAVMNNYNFKLSFENNLIVGQLAIGSVLITDSQGQYVENLQPIMGEFAHIVGFYDDFSTILHAHPMGREINLKDLTSGPEINFHINPKQKGFIRLFVQVKINDTELFIPFGVSASYK